MTTPTRWNIRRLLEIVLCFEALVEALVFCEIVITMLYMGSSVIISNISLVI